jgi:hypothetical protein
MLVIAQPRVSAAYDTRKNVPGHTGARSAQPERPDSAEGKRWRACADAALRACVSRGTAEALKSCLLEASR